MFYQVARLAGIVNEYPGMFKERFFPGHGAERCLIDKVIVDTVLLAGSHWSGGVGDGNTDVLTLL